MWTTPLHELRAVDVGVAGGKGANLGELIAAGLPVPDGFVVTVDAYRSVVGLDADDCGDLEAAIRAGLLALGRDVVVAVRSSAVAEDGTDASYAGINETVQNVRGEAAVLDAVRQCWASASAARVDRYEAARGGPAGEGGVAVVVQRQIASACAGVAFSVDPSGTADTILIEAARGLGEAVVSGLLTPDRIAVDRRPLQIATYDSGGQQTLLELAGDGDGLAERGLSAAEAGQPALLDEQVLAIARHALRIEDHYGCPQDIEWAIDADGALWILQARPITTLDRAAATTAATALFDHARPQGSRWTRANVGEALPGVPTPLTWSLWSAGIEQAHWAAQILLGVVPAREDRSRPVVVLADGWPAISVDLVEDQLARLPGFDPQAFAEQFFGGSTSAAHVPARARIGTAARVATRAPSTLALLPRRLRRTAATSAGIWEREAWQPVEDPISQLDRAAARFAATMTVHTLQTYACQGLYQAVERVAGDLASQLVSGDGDLSEARLASDLWRLAQGDLTEATFLRRHGFHGPNEGELATRSWREDPTPIRETAAAWANADASRDPDSATGERLLRRHDAEATLLAAAPRLRRAALRRLITLARRAVVAREVGKAAFLQDLDVARHAARALGEDSSWHTLDELRGHCAPSPADLVARRRVRERFAATEPPLTFVQDAGASRATLRDRDTDPSATVVCGIGASPGVVRGRARIITDPANPGPPLRPDEVLVARTTDPSWVTIFFTAGGIAIDIGGALSHAAIIARELGLPCVIGTGDGTRSIPPGALVELDGQHGTIRILEPPATAPVLTGATA